jgi:hypothetical protein
MPANIVPPVRDYYRVEDDDGGRFWLFRDGPLNARQVVSCTAFARERHAVRRAPGHDQLQLPARRLASGRAGLPGGELGHYAIGIADRNTLAGVVRAYSASRNSTRRPTSPEAAGSSCWSARGSRRATAIRCSPIR